MIQDFNELSSSEIELMLDVPALVAVLIAGADDDIDRNEVKAAMDIADLKKITGRKSLNQYYAEIDQIFDDRFAHYINTLPSTAEERNPIIIERLSQVNEVLPKLDKVFASQFYDSMRDFARKIAKASGGVLGYLAVGYKESKLIDLDMIQRPG